MMDKDAIIAADHHDSRMSKTRHTDHHDNSSSKTRHTAQADHNDNRTHNTRDITLEDHDATRDPRYEHTNSTHHGNMGEWVVDDDIPLCVVDTGDCTRCEQQLRAAPRANRFLQAFQPRLSVLEPEEQEVTNAVPSVDLLVLRRRENRSSGAYPVPNTTLWLVLSAVSALCCGWFFGVFALIYICQAREERSKGRYWVSRHALFKARVLLCVGAVVGLIAWMAIAYRLYDSLNTTGSSAASQSLGNSTDSSALGRI